ncbi:cytochrome c peroxidase [Fulvivirgaceae bacterium BMA10]|uniref:Cytochrome c peroxidase n=1 Tax=Splendidivirga corallicola TaxID=3051826 RepID=A0ABT8KQH7_9BACT|nr:cytochrome c peroxidase [Fulvivirgaceae bacterium BMA10]
MRKVYLIPHALLIFFICIYISAFQSPENNIKSADVVSIIQEKYEDEVLEFGSSLDHLKQKIESLDQTKERTTALKSAFSKTRNQFKKIEFLAEYFDPEYIKDYINGPPLSKLERNSPQLSVLEPQGLQVLEEVIYDDEVYGKKEELHELISKLIDHYNEFSTYQNKIHLQDRHIFEASRYELIRIFTLGVTGFDSPVALNSIEEAHYALTSVYEAVKNYFPLLNDEGKVLGKQLDHQFRETLSFLEENNDFNSFDRLVFLKEHINPLFKHVLDVQLALQIETYYETTPLTQKHSINYFATDIFSNDLLNPYYYLDLTEKRDHQKVIELGKYLFFDPILSQNNERSCASCHKPELGFSDGKTKSTAFNFESTVKRNSPTLINSIYSDRYFYDLRAEVLEEQFDHVIHDQKEFRTTYLTIFKKLEKSEEYLKLFKEAFPDLANDPIKKYTLNTALSAYIKSLSGFNTPFDQYVRGERKEIGKNVADGFNLFMGKAGCGTCHFAPVFNGSVPPTFHESESEVLGVPATADLNNTTLDTDLGRYSGVLKEAADIYRHSFKTTTVRNITLTAPYMHNGVFQSLEEVVEFYDQGGGAGIKLDVPNQTLPPDPLELTDKEKGALVSFMRSLTDTTGMTSIPERLPRFENNEKLNNRVIGGKY